MEIKGKVHCFFEQSGTFKNEFIKLGIPAEDYDIQNKHQQTDHVIDLFQEIENAYDGKESIFDNITNDDLIIAFFPCIYFSCMSQMLFGWNAHNYKKLTIKQKTDTIITRTENREHYYKLLIKLFAVVEMKGQRMIVENPWAMQHYLKANFIVPPTLIDNDRSLRGDNFKKPTAYWFWHCHPTSGYSLQKNKNIKKIINCKHDKGGGICSEERSTINPNYARNFICDFIIGKEQNNTEKTLF